MIEEQFSIGTIYCDCHSCQPTEPICGCWVNKIKRYGVNVRNLPPRFYERGYIVRDLKDAASFVRKIPFLKSRFSKGGVNLGRKMKLVATTKSHLTKEEKIARKKIEDKASDGLEALQITPPKHFDAIAKAEYKRVINDLRKLPLRNLDRAILETYCTWYAVYKEISRGLQKEGYVYKTSSGKVLPNKMLYSLERATTNLTRAASQLGLTVDSRMKLYVPQVEEKKTSIFDKFGG